MKVKFEPNEFEVGKEYHGKIIEIEPVIVKPLLQKAEGYDEVFLIKKEENIKQWIMNPETFEKRGYDWNKIELVSLSGLKEYPVGESLNDFGMSKNPPDIYYPEPYPFKGIRALLTLKSKPNRQQITDLGFNAIMPYSGSVDWTGDYISIPKDRPGKVILRFTGDELDCNNNKRDNPTPQEDVDECLRMKLETPEIMVGINLEGSIGCGISGCYESVEKYREEWVKVINKVNYVSLNVYPYRRDWPDPLEKMEEFYNFWKANITVPIIPVIQAHWITVGLTKPDPIEQVKFWFSKGLTGFVAYCWADENKGVRDMQDEWKEANNWARKESI